ncbi:MAG: hypothetical protein EOO10_14515, partial [Chitinophagaceae bacterium]
SNFILLSEEEKKVTVFRQGVPLAQRENDSWKVFLFQLEDYYVETFCNKQNKAIEEYRVFGDTELLQPYLQAIPINDLLR